MEADAYGGPCRDDMGIGIGGACEEDRLVGLPRAVGCIVTAEDAVQVAISSSCAHWWFGESVVW